MSCNKRIAVLGASIVSSTAFNRCVILFASKRNLTRVRRTCFSRYQCLDPLKPNEFRACRSEPLHSGPSLSLRLRTFPSLDGDVQQGQHDKGKINTMSTIINETINTSLCSGIRQSLLIQTHISKTGRGPKESERRTSQSDNPPPGSVVKWDSDASKHAAGRSDFA